MTTSLIDSLNQVASPDLVTRIASSLGEPEQNVSRGLTGGMASMLVGLLGKMSDTSAMQNIFGMLTDSANDTRVLDNPSALVGGGGSSALSMLASRFTSTLFGSRASAVNDGLAKSSGLRIGSISSLLQTAAPLVLGMLGKRVRDGGLNLGSFTRLLNDERDSIQRAAPPEVFSALGLEQRTAEPHYERGYETKRVETQPRSTYAREPEHQGRSWFWPVAATVAALALLWGMWPRHREPNVAVRDTAQAVGGEVVPSMPATAPGVVAAGRIALPSGDTISAADNSPESRLVLFLRDPARRPDKTTWIALDQAQFDQGSANLSPNADAQIANVAMILKAFPNASVKIGGYADATGGNAAANKKIALARAEAIRKALIAKGVVASHLAAEAEGTSHAAMDTSAMAAAPTTGRVAVLVTRK
jgi:outer membrane protein OmpA-like peptidoglycan-associated protein